jgi:hypothetical protein
MKFRKKRSAGVVYRHRPISVNFEHWTKEQVSRPYEEKKVKQSLCTPWRRLGGEEV